MEYLKEPGTYEAMIIAADAGQSKKGDPMLTVTFKEIGGKGGGEIRSYFVPKFEFMAQKLAELKLSVGVSPTAKKEDLLGKKVVIGVRTQIVKPGQEKINPKTNLPYAPSAEVFEYIPYVENKNASQDSALPF